ncbi:hypothetical protein SCUCBS95973_009001 [Sporothrix curviconia]|uniref:BZIP transcription factor n=1 Tax=Sporothrix curviconia TaxID=1260050 RepID=A0ABP0CUA4_9PEZI
MDPAKSSMTRDGPSSSSSATEARRLRKRELDRHAQRCARQRTKDRIAFLEQRLEESYRAEPGQRRVAALMDELAAVKQQRDELMGIVSSIQKMLQTKTTTALAAQRSSAGPDREQAPTASLDVPLDVSIDVPLDSSSFSLPDAATTMAGSNAFTAATSATPPLSFPLAGDALYPPSAFDITTRDAGTGDIPENVEPEPEPEPQPIMPLPETPCHCITVDQRMGGGTSPSSGNIWRSVNCTLMKREKTASKALSHPRPQAAPAADTLFAEDVPVRAVVQGWPAVEQAGLLSAAWKKLRAVDELCFATCDKVVRLAVLATMYIFLRWDTDPSPQNLQAMPPWYLQRPSQKMAHSGAIDYFVWPGVRERFVFSQHRYCSNLFWDSFSANLRILWAHGIDSCYHMDFMTGHYCISPTFKSQIRDLRCWTMLRGFFDHFPELACDIPTYEQVPRVLPQAHVYLANGLSLTEAFAAGAAEDRCHDHQKALAVNMTRLNQNHSHIHGQSQSQSHGQSHNHMDPIDIASDEFWQFIGSDVQAFSQH